MQQASLQNYLQQQALAQQFEGGMAGRQGIQDAAQAQALGIINGQGMNVTEQEAAAIEQQRQAYMGNATADVNKMLDQRLQGISQSAGIAEIAAAALRAVAVAASTVALAALVVAVAAARVGSAVLVAAQKKPRRCNKEITNAIIQRDHADDPPDGREYLRWYAEAKRLRERERSRSASQTAC
jgi:hypothetical protein